MNGKHTLFYNTHFAVHLADISFSICNGVASLKYTANILLHRLLCNEILFYVPVNEL